MGSKFKDFMSFVESIFIVIVALVISYFGVNWLLTYFGIDSSWNFGIILVVFFLLIVLSVWIITKVEVPRSRNVRKISIIMFALLFILCSAIFIIIFKDKMDCYEQITTIISLVVSFLTSFNILNQDSLDLLPSVYSKNLIIKNNDIILDLSDNCNLNVTISNFEKYPVKVAYMGIYTEEEFNILKVEAKDAQRKYLFLSSVAKETNLEYENVPGYGISQPHFEPLSKDDQGTHYAVYADIFYKLHSVKFICTNSKEIKKSNTNVSDIIKKCKDKNLRPLFAKPKDKSIVVANSDSIQIGGDNGEPLIIVK